MTRRKPNRTPRKTRRPLLERFSLSDLES